MLRNVADYRHVSVHDLLSPPPVLEYAPHPRLGDYALTFDPYAGWSWREVLVWGTDSERSQREKAAQQSEAESQQMLEGAEAYYASIR